MQDGIAISDSSFTKPIHPATIPAGKQQLLVRSLLIRFIPLLNSHIIGQNNQAGKSILKTDYSENNNVEKNLKVSVKILLKTMDSTTPSPERIELSVLKREDDGSMTHYMLNEKEVSALIEEIQKEVEAEQKKAEATSGDI